MWGGVTTLCTLFLFTKCLFCLDINECFHDNGDCEGICENTNGGYRCNCYNGYMIDPNNTKGCLGKSVTGNRHVYIMYGDIVYERKYKRIDRNYLYKSI